MTERSVIFLDVDGVLCLTATAEEAVLDASATAELARLVAAHPADIVLSSTWRLVPALQARIAEHLAVHGLALTGQTPEVSPAEAHYRTRGVGWLLEQGFDLDGLARGHELHRWLLAHSAVTRWVALDDLPLPIGRHQVRTDYPDGLTTAHVARALEVLASPALPLGDVFDFVEAP